MSSQSLPFKPSDVRGFFFLLSFLIGRVSCWQGDCDELSGTARQAPVRPRGLGPVAPLAGAVTPVTSTSAGTARVDPQDWHSSSPCTAEAGPSLARSEKDEGGIGQRRIQSMLLVSTIDWRMIDGDKSYIHTIEMLKTPHHGKLKEVWSSEDVSSNFCS